MVARRYRMENRGYIKLDEDADSDSSDNASNSEKKDVFVIKEDVRPKSPVSDNIELHS